MKNTFSGDKPVAIITGATTGIGAAYARRLAADGWDLALIDQRASRMEEEARTYRDEFGTACKIVEAELADQTVLMGLEQEIREIPRVDMLINDAGYWMPGNYEETDPFAIEDMIRVHNIVPARLIRAVLPFMLQHNRGSIINVSSLSALVNLPDNENYAATKAYLVTLTESLKATLYKTRIQLQVLIPGLPLGSLRRKKGADDADAEGMLLPEQVVSASLKMLAKDRVVCIPNWRTRFYLRRLRLLPRRWYYRRMFRIGRRLEKDWGG